MKMVTAQPIAGHGRGIQYVEHTEGDGGEMFKAVCKRGLEGIVSKKLDAPYRSPSITWIKVKNPVAHPTDRRILQA
jgi:bifunctional non-homologous end joining protein LigD